MMRNLMLAIALFFSVSTLFKFANVKCSPQIDFSKNEKMLLRSTASDKLIIMSNENRLHTSSVNSILQKAATEAFRYYINVHSFHS